MIAQKGWTLDAFDNMRRLDSFMLETCRHKPLADIVLVRKCVRSTTLSDGTTLSPGVLVSAARAPRALDERFYPRANEFDGMRFYDTAERFSDADKTPPRNLSFGAGKHAWYSLSSRIPATASLLLTPVYCSPGRFFATAIIKASVATLLTKYELLPGSKEQMEISFEETRLSSMKAKISLRPLELT